MKSSRVRFVTGCPSASRTVTESSTSCVRSWTSASGAPSCDGRGAGRRPLCPKPGAASVTTAIVVSAAENRGRKRIALFYSRCKPLRQADVERTSFGRTKAVRRNRRARGYGLVRGLPCDEHSKRRVEGLEVDRLADVRVRPRLERRFHERLTERGQD